MVASWYFISIPSYEKSPAVKCDSTDVGYFGTSDPSLVHCTEKIATKRASAESLNLVVIIVIVLSVPLSIKIPNSKKG